MKWLLLIVLEQRVQRLTRDLLRHGNTCCVGVPDHCDQWAAISEMYDDALRRLQEAK